MSKYRVLIPDCIVRNEEGIKINPKAFCLYYYLKILYDKQKKRKVEFNHNKFMFKFGIKSNTTLKSMLKSLYDNSLINTEITQLNRHDNLIIELNDKYIMKKPFTLMHINLYYMVNKIGCDGIRLMYYYESRINRNKDSHQFCFTGVRRISAETKVNKNKINDVNRNLKKSKILKIECHGLENTYEYDEFDQEIKSRYNNHYVPLLDKIEKFNVQE